MRHALRMLLTATTAGALLAGCGSAPQYEFRVYALAPEECYAGERACVDTIRYDCTIGVDFDLECPELQATFAIDDIVTDRVELDPDALAVEMGGHGCLTSFLCDRFSLRAELAPDATFRGRGQLDELGIRYAIHGNLR